MDINIHSSNILCNILAQSSETFHKCLFIIVLSKDSAKMLKFLLFCKSQFSAIMTKVYRKAFFVLLYKRSRFHFSVCLFSYELLQRRGQNVMRTTVTHLTVSCMYFFVLTLIFGIICALVKPGGDSAGKWVGVLDKRF